MNGDVFMESKQQRNDKLMPLTETEIDLSYNNNKKTNKDFAIQAHMIL